MYWLIIPITILAWFVLVEQMELVPRDKRNLLLIGMTSVLSTLFSMNVVLTIVFLFQSMWMGALDTGLSTVVVALILWQRRESLHILSLTDRAVEAMGNMNTMVLKRLELFSWLEQFGTRQLAYLKSIHSKEGVEWSVEANGFAGNHTRGTTILAALEAAKTIDDMVEGKSP